MITPGDAARILGKISAYDQRTVGDTDVAAWHEALNLANPPITATDALTAVAAWHATATDGRIRPAHVITGAQTAARTRTAAASRHTPGCWGVPAGSDIATQIRELPATQPGVDAAGVAKLRAALERAAAGMTIPAADVPKTRSDEIRQRAITRARAERAGRLYAHAPARPDTPED